jgi:hypothetical protein
VGRRVERLDAAQERRLARARIAAEHRHARTGANGGAQPIEACAALGRQPNTRSEDGGIPERHVPRVTLNSRQRTPGGVRTP